MNRVYDIERHLAADEAPFIFDDRAQVTGDFVDGWGSQHKSEEHLCNGLRGNL